MRGLLDGLKWRQDEKPVVRASDPYGSFNVTNEQIIDAEAERSYAPLFKSADEMIDGRFTLVACAAARLASPLSPRSGHALVDASSA